MAFDLERIRTELAAAPAVAPVPQELAVAIVNDTFRLAGVRPIPASTWKQWARGSAPEWREQLEFLAHALATTSLRVRTVHEIRPQLDATSAVEAFFATLGPLRAEILRGNAFRQEELLRKWIAALGGEVAGEQPEESRRKLEQLDYRRTLAEYRRADQARSAEAKRRARLLAEAAKREQEARGWRE